MPGDCILYCNTAECLILDEEKCECNTDLECIREKYFGPDHDIDPENCGCQVEDGGIWCSYLTDDSIKTWKFIFAYDTIRSDTLNNVLSYGWKDPAGLYHYSVDHVYIRDRGNDYRLSYEPDVYIWEFDNINQPKKMFYNGVMIRSSVDQTKEFEITIIKLNPDTLITTWNEGEFPGWILLVPNDS